MSIIVLRILKQALDFAGFNEAVQAAELAFMITRWDGQWGNGASQTV